MSTLVLYNGKYGYCEKIAHEIAGENLCVSVSDTIEMKEDLIILGCSVYASMIDKKVVLMIQNNKDRLNHKKIVLFICGLMKDEQMIEKEVEDTFKEDKSLFSQIIYAGGCLDFDKLNFMEKTIIKMVNKKEKLIEKIDNKKCYEFRCEEGIQQLKELVKNSR